MASTTSLGRMKEAMSCDVCLAVYDHIHKTPLVLPCGHTFCRLCLVSIKASGQYLCPTCRTQPAVDVEALAVNYSLLSITSPCNDLEYEECSAHGDTLRYWCCTCGIPLCGFCLHSSHFQNHTIKLTQVMVQEEKQKLVEEVKTVCTTVEDKHIELKALLSDLYALMKEVFRRNANLQNIALELNDLLAKIQKTTDIPSVECLKKTVEEAKKKLSLSGDQMVGEEAAESVESNTPLVQKQDSSTLPQQQCKAPQVRCGVMDFRDGRLLMHSLAGPESKQLSLQMPSEVFLELSVGDTRLGCVYISLWSQMRLAQQFLSLCMGTMGPSLLGLKASEKLRGIIIFKFPAVGASKTPMSPLLTNLEWGGQHAKLEVKGYVMGVDGNNGMAFGICTREHGKSILSAPFGKVVVGLDVAIKAFRHNSLTEITITRCGIVLPGFQ